MEELLPKHIAIIMDGNRRWARKRNLPIKMGHKEGAETLKKVVRYANKRGIEYITVYAFSTENWKREKEGRPLIYPEEPRENKEKPNPYKDAFQQAYPDKEYIPFASK